MPNALAVVAHHDDHILWMGGTIQRMRSQGWDWTLIAMCVQSSLHSPYFYLCSEALHSTGQPLSFHDEQKPPAFAVNQRAAMEAALLNAVKRATFDFVFTHSRDQHGEYGYHANHDEVAQVVKSLVNQGHLCRGPQCLTYFCYGPLYGGNRKATVARTDATYYLQLTYPELRHKADLSGLAPDVNGSLYELGFPCPNPEAFEGDGLSLPAPFIRGDRAKP